MKKLIYAFSVLLILSSSLFAQHRSDYELFKPFLPMSNSAMSNDNGSIQHGVTSYTSRWFGWAYDFNTTRMHIIKSRLNSPGNLTNIGPSTLRSILGGAIADNGVFFGLEYVSPGVGNLVQIDTLTGNIATIGPLTGLVSNQIVTGMAWEKSSNQMFVIAGGNVSSLYTVNLTTGNLTTIAAIMNGANGAIDVAINNQGIMYSWDILTDNLYTIDKTTGTATIVGPLGIDILSAQGGGFDPETDSLYLAAMIVPENYGALYSCNTSTGAATYIGHFGTQSTEIDAFVIPRHTSYPLNSFNLQSPPQGSRIVTIAGSSTPVNIAWDTSATGASYKYIFGNPSVPPRRFSIYSEASSLSMTLGELDLLLSSNGFTNNGSSSDSATGQWDVWAYRGPNALGPDSMKSSNGPRAITLRRQRVSLNPFALVSPASGITIVTSPANQSNVRFDWNSSANGGTYKWLYKTGSSYSDPATLNIDSQLDTFLIMRNAQLDSILASTGMAPGDSISGYWKARTFNSSDSLSSSLPDRHVTFRRAGLMSLSQSFTDPAFPPTSWDLLYSGSLWWLRQDGTSSYGSDQGGCAKFNIWFAPAGTNQSLVSNQFNPVSSSTTRLKFDWTQAYYLSGGIPRNDSLIIYSSSNGGQSYTKLIGYGANTELFSSLSTTGAQGQYVPPFPENFWGTKNIPVPAGTNKIRFEARSDYGNNLYIDSIRLTDSLVAITNLLNLTPEEFSLEQNFPNPFNPKTIIKYQLPNAGFVSLKVYDVLGREIGTLINEKQNNGIYTVEWDASGFSSGIYFCRIEVRSDDLQSEYFVDTRRMMLIK